MRDFIYTHFLHFPKYYKALILVELYRHPKGLTYLELYNEIAPNSNYNRFCGVIDDLCNNQIIDYYMGRFTLLIVED